MASKDDALFTNSTLAIDPATGKMKWWFQHSPGDSLDMDDVFERVLVDDDGKKLLFTIGKTGILWKLDRASGKYLDHVEAVRQNIVKSVDSQTGRVTYRPDIVNAKLGDIIHSCPASFGSHIWQAMSYDERGSDRKGVLQGKSGAVRVNLGGAGE